jgi:4-amino-4-deoxy-L-arabinose transferase-like glycosyltransferase
MPPQDPTDSPRADRRPDLLVIVLLGLVALVTWLTSARAGDFWWSDAPRHAMNGAFVLDLLHAWPADDPVQWAYGYYLQHPAVTILFYPPLFYAFLAAGYELFGVDHAVAQGMVALFHWGLLIAIYALSRRWLSRPAAFGCALIAGAGPELLVWTRQVMLDVPAYAFLVLAVILLLRWLDRGDPMTLRWFVAAELAAIYTKFNVGFMLPVLGLTILAARGPRALLDRQVLLAGGIFGVLMLPGVWMTMEFGIGNIDSVVGSERPDAARTSLEAWSYYLRIIPQQLGWPVAVLAVIGVVGAAWRRSLSRRDLALLGGWFVVGYTAFSMIMVREPRHSLMILLPVAVAAMAACDGLREKLGRQAGVLAVTVAVGTTAWGLFANPAPRVTGHAEAARVVAQEAEPGTAVLFSGYRDANFVFALRALEADLSTVRADKLLLRLFIELERGVEDLDFDREEILDLIRRHAMRYVVHEPGFWTQLPSMRALDELLEDRSLFEPIARIPIESHLPVEAKEVVVLRYLGEVQSPPEPLELEMVGIGRTISAPK